MFSSFMTDSWIAGSLVAVVAGVVGFFVVLRGSSFAAHALPMGCLPGAAAANLLGINVYAGLIAFALIGVLGISQLGRRGQHDVATALCLVTLLGLAALFLSMTTEYSQGVFSLLFGEVLGVGGGQLVPVGVMSVVSIAAIAALFRPLLLSSVSPELAEARGVPAGRMELWFLMVLAFATSTALPVVGALLVFSLMVGPASAARSFSDRPVVALLLSVVISLITIWAAIALSFVLNWPVGFFVGGFGAICYAAGRLWARPGLSVAA